MGNKFYESGERRAAKVQDLFATIAPRYDLINDLQSFGLHRFWKRRLLELAAVRPGDRVLDVCCGTGDVALQFAIRGMRVTALDFSPAMLDVARARSCAAKLDVEWLSGDALALPMSSDQFDAVVVSYGLRNLADPQAGLREMHRVAKPGGRIVVLDFGKPRHLLLRKTYFAYLGCWVPLFGRLLCGDRATHAYILESLRHYPAQDGVATFMRELGCEDVRIFNLMGGMMSINRGSKAALSQRTIKGGDCLSHPRPKMSRS